MSGLVVNLDSLELTDHRHGDRFAARIAAVASRVGAHPCSEKAGPARVARTLCSRGAGVDYRAGEQ